MTSRRTVLISGGATALVATVLGVPVAFSSEEDFICGTVDPGPSTEAEIAEFAGEGEVGIAEAVAQLEQVGITPYGTFSLSRRWLLKDGVNGGKLPITLGVHFIDGSEEQKSAVRTHAVKWLTGELKDRLAFAFDVDRSSAQISITFDTNKNSSIVGRESRKYALDGPTMYLGQVGERTICHEFGHALGFSHEHSHPNNGIEWDEAVVIADMAKQGWTPEMVRHNIFQRFSASFACLGDPDMNPESIMMYPIPEIWTKNKFSTGLNTKIHDRDRKCSVAVYNT